ncbi:MAG: gas vesicle protein [Chloroflexi bacterium]|nr:gas vesicle protein [Chloroflexota bacterium]
MEMPEALERARRQLAEVTGLTPVSVVRAQKSDAGWQVRVEMLEMVRIPSSTDVIGNYEVLLSEEGSLLSFERKRTRLRSEVGDEEGTSEWPSQLRVQR